MEWSNKKTPPLNYDYSLQALSLISKDGYDFELEITQTITINPEDAPKVLSFLELSFIDRIIKQDQVLSQSSSDNTDSNYNSIRNLIDRINFSKRMMMCGIHIDQFWNPFVFVIIFQCCTTLLFYSSRSTWKNCSNDRG